jgi:hypothetical protein
VFPTARATRRECGSCRCRARRTVRRLPDHRLLLRRAFADEIADHDQAGGDADANLELADGGHVEPPDRGDDVEAGPHRPLRIVFVRSRIAEINQHSVAHVFGDKSLAAPLQALAQPGQVVIAPATRRLLGNLFRLCGLGRQEVKGLSEPVEAWAVEGVSASEGRFATGALDDRGGAAVIGTDHHAQLFGIEPRRERS